MTGPLQSGPPVRLLLVEDDEADADLLAMRLGPPRGDAQITHVVTLSDAIVNLDDGDFDVVVLDLSLPDAIGVSGLERLLSRDACPPVVVLTGNEDTELAQHALGMGAHDHIVKGRSDDDPIRRAIRDAVARGRMAEQLASLENDAEHVQEHERIVQLRQALTPPSGVSSTSEAIAAAGDAYAELLRAATVRRRFGAAVEVDERAERLIDGLVAAGATPVDVLDVHAAALAGALGGLAVPQARAVRDEARYLCLETMARLASRCQGAPPREAPTRPEILGPRRAGSRGRPGSAPPGHLHQPGRCRS